MKNNPLGMKNTPATQVPIVPNNNGYPNNVPNTQTVKTRGTGAATKGTHSSKKLA
jgi:hypothetical protein